LSFAWTQTAGPSVELLNPGTPTPRFVANLSGAYTFKLTVADGEGYGKPATVNITVPKLGDTDLDGDVDALDIARITLALGRPASGGNDPRDLNGDGKIDLQDIVRAIKLCTRLQCAIR